MSSPDGVVAAALSRVVWWTMRFAWYARASGFTSDLNCTSLVRGVPFSVTVGGASDCQRRILKSGLYRVGGVPVPPVRRKARPLAGSIWSRYALSASLKSSAVESVFSSASVHADPTLMLRSSGVRYSFRRPRTFVSDRFSKFVGFT